MPIIGSGRKSSDDRDRARFNRRDKTAAIDSRRVGILMQPPAGIGAPVCVLGLV